MMEGSTGEPFQDDDLPPDEDMSPGSKEISDSADKISKLSDRENFLIKRMKT